jgi:hypothetical protein
MRLTGKQREQLCKAFLSAFPNQEDLVVMLSFHLDTNLSNVPVSSNYSYTLFNLIEYYEQTQGELDALIEAAHKRNPGNSDLNTFYNDVWLPLKSQASNPALNQEQNKTKQFQAPTAEIQKNEPASGSVSENQSHTSVTADQEKNVTGHRDISDQQTLEKQDKQEGVAGPSKETPKTPKEKAHAHIMSVRGNLQGAYDKFDQEDRLFEDECAIVSEDVRNADGAVFQALKELGQVPTNDVQAYYGLEEKQTYFSSEASKITDLISHFDLAYSVTKHKDVQCKIGSLQRILEDIDSLIDQFCKSMD